MVAYTIFLAFLHAFRTIRPDWFNINDYYSDQRTGDKNGKGEKEDQKKK